MKNSLKSFWNNANALSKEQQRKIVGGDINCRYDVMDRNGRVIYSSSGVCPGSDANACTQAVAKASIQMATALQAEGGTNFSC